MSTKPSTVANGMAASLAIKTLAVRVESDNAVTPTVHSQHAATVSAYLPNWLATGFSVAANTHQRFKQKWSVTAKGYATATAANRGIKNMSSQIRQKSARATTPPTTQNRNSFLSTSNIERAGNTNQAANLILIGKQEFSQKGWKI